MEWRDAFGAVVGALTLIFGWMLKNASDAIRELRADDKKIADAVAHLETKMASEFVHKDDLRQISDAIFKKLDRIEEKLDRKVDR